VTTLADLFSEHYRFTEHYGAGGIDFSAIRIHYSGADPVCAALGAQAFTIGSDIYFRTGSFAPRTREGLRLLAHEVAHVVQQRRGPVDAVEVAGGLAVAEPGSPAEREADAAAAALLAGREFCFASREHSADTSDTSGPAGQRRADRERPVIQRYMAWEHALLGDMEPARVATAAAAVARAGQNGTRPAGLAYIEAHCALLEQLGQDPRGVDHEKLRRDHPDVEILRLPGSGLVVTLGELNILPDYLAHPAEIETAPAEFLEPLLQTIRSWNIAELSRSAGRQGPRRRLRGSMRYPRMGRLAEIYEAMEVDALGRRCGFAPWDLYSSVVGRNAGHFAPFSWYRWQSFHLMARDLIARSGTATDGEREDLRTRAQIYAGYADHFLQDSYAAGHLINKTLVMQWYIEWLADSHIPFLDRQLLAGMTPSRQPMVHGPGHYDLTPAGPRPAGPRPGSDARPCWPQDPQSAIEAPTLKERIEASGVVGDTERDRRDAYSAYLAMLGSSVAQLAAGVVHEYLNNRSLVVAAGADGPRFRLQGDHTLLAGGEGVLRTAQAAAASRRSISELLHRGGTDITSEEILAGFPDHVEQDGVLVTLRHWHQTGLRELCDQELFGRWPTQLKRIVLSAFSRRLGVPSADVEALRTGG
jgi:hypothetical protein